MLAIKWLWWCVTVERVAMLARAHRRAVAAESATALRLAAANFTEGERRGGNAGGLVAMAKLSELAPRVAAYQRAAEEHERAAARTLAREARGLRWARWRDAAARPAKYWMGAGDVSVGMGIGQWFSGHTVQTVLGLLIGG